MLNIKIKCKYKFKFIYLNIFKSNMFQIIILVSNRMQSAIRWYQFNFNSNNNRKKKEKKNYKYYKFITCDKTKNQSNKKNIALKFETFYLKKTHR